MRDTVLELLQEISDEVDFEGCTDLIDGGVLSSLDVIQIIAAMNEEFDISIPAMEIVPANFNSLDAMVALVERLAEE